MQKENMLLALKNDIYVCEGAYNQFLNTFICLSHVLLLITSSRRLLNFNEISCGICRFQSLCCEITGSFKVNTC